MKGPFRAIYTRVWDDERFRQLSEEAQLTWFHLFSNPYSTGIGLYRMPLAGLAADKGCQLERYAERCAEVERNGLVVIDREHNLVWFPRFWQWNKPDNPNTLKKLLKALGKIPDCTTKSQFIQTLSTHCMEWGGKFTEIRDEIIGTLGETLPVTPPVTQGTVNSEQEVRTTSDDVVGHRPDGPPTNAIDETRQKTRTPHCPAQEIVDLYHEILPMCPPIHDLGAGTLRADLRARWRSKAKFQRLEWWRHFFETIRDRCPFLIGQKHDSNRRPFTGGLRWFVKASNFAKIVEGHYLEERAA